MWARIHLIPLLQAEEDRDQVRRYWADQKREKELLGDNTKVYHNDRCVFLFSPPLVLRPSSTQHHSSSSLVTSYPIAIADIFSHRFVRPTFAVAPEPSK